MSGCAVQKKNGLIPLYAGDKLGFIPRHKEVKRVGGNEMKVSVFLVFLCLFVSGVNLLFDWTTNSSDVYYKGDDTTSKYPEGGNSPIPLMRLLA